MKELFTLAIVAFIGQLAMGQGSKELVPNGGFEMLDKEIKTYDQLRYATGWTNATLGLSEVFSKEGSAKTVGIPVNDYGSMSPVEGEHYAGFCGWKDDVRRNMDATDMDDQFVPGWNAYSEYVQCELSEALREGAEYEVLFHVALSGNSDRTIMGIGAHFHKGLIDLQNRKFIEEVPQVFLEKGINEKGKWIEVRDTFKAYGGENTLVIGIFPYVGGVTTNLIEGADNRYAYYYLDGISVKAIAKSE